MSRASPSGQAGPAGQRVACRDRAAMLSAVQANWQVLAIASRSIRASAEVVFAAVRQDGRALELAAEPLRANRSVVYQT
eukprot:761242-Heterocapsa_arctica.AAC.1